jgi:hypothetical protein
MLKNYLLYTIASEAPVEVGQLPNKVARVSTNIFFLVCKKQDKNEVFRRKDEPCVLG